MKKVRVLHLVETYVHSIRKLPFNRFITSLPPQRLSFVLLAISFAIRLSLIYVGTFVDEGDTIVVGMYINQGKLLYKDIFSHHFPFPYYWIAFVFSLFSTSIFSVRLSILIFQFVSFGLVMRLTGFYTLIGLAGFIWGVIAHFYFGNMAIYQVFSGVALAMVLTLVLALTTKKCASSPWIILSFGTFSLIAILSDPFSVLPIAISVIILLITQDGLETSRFATLIISLGIVFFLHYLLFSSSYLYFVRDVIDFNIHTYGNYYNTNPTRLLDTINRLLSGLDFLKPSKWINANSAPWLGTFSNFEQWLLGGFIFRISIIICSVVMFVRKQYLSAIYIYFFSAAMLIRDEITFYQIGFVFTSIIIATWLICDRWIGTVNSKYLSFLNMKKCVLLRNIQNTTIIKAFISLLLFWLVFRGLVSTINQHEKLSYSVNFGGYEKQAKEIIDSSCGKDTRLGYYPGDPMVHFFTEMPPISKYLFIYPWVADVATYDVLKALDAGEEEKIIVYINKKGSIWGRKNTDFLGDIINYLDANYFLDENDFYLSPKLVDTCNYPADISK